MKFHELQVLSDRPFLLVQVWVDVVVPSLSALLPDPAREERGDLFPLFETELRDFLLKNHILLRCPVSLDLLDCTILSVVSEQEPSVHAFDLGLYLTVDGVLLGWKSLSLLFNKLVQLRVNDVDLLDLVP